jgi:hypothetical protein
MYFGDVQCRLCNLDIDCQIHILTCEALKKNFSWNHDIKYEFIYGTLEQQVQFMNMFSSLMEVREQPLEKGD